MVGMLQVPLRLNQAKRQPCRGSWVSLGPPARQVHLLSSLRKSCSVSSQEEVGGKALVMSSLTVWIGMLYGTVWMHSLLRRSAHCREESQMSSDGLNCSCNLQNHVAFAFG